MPKVAAKNSVSMVVGEGKVDISDKAWSCIETAYGHPLSREARDQIVTATAQFLKFEASERYAEPLAWTKAKIERIRAAADKLRLEFVSKAKGDDTLLEAKY